MQKVDLHSRAGGADKVYHLLQIGCELHARNGKRGSGLAAQPTKAFPTEAKAVAAFQTKLTAQLTKGYKLADGISGNVWGYIGIDLAKPGTDCTVVMADPSTRRMDKTPSGFLPQLLNEISETDAQKYIQDDAWGAQEKKNGRRHTVLLDPNNSGPHGVNKLGFAIPTFVTFTKPLTRVEMDGEAISSKLYAFDLLRFGDRSFKDDPYITRYEWLVFFHERYCNESVELVPLHLGTEAKQALWDRVKTAGGEGIVFKRLDAVHTEGRPNRLGDQLKVIFWQHTQVMITGLTDGKRSAAMACYDLVNQVWKSMGNVTIPANYDMPAVGDFAEIRYKYYYEGGSLFQPQYEGTTDVATREDTDYMKLLRFTPEE